MKRSLGLRLCRFIDSAKLIGAPDLASELNEAIEELDAVDKTTWPERVWGALWKATYTAVVIIIASVATGTIFTATETPHYKMPIPLTKEEALGDRVVGVTTPNNSITIEWDDSKYFTAKSLGNTVGAAGSASYSKYHLNWPLTFISWGAHCVIHLPAGSKIEGDPLRPNSGVMWSNPADDEVLAHEILHCLRGDWHWNPPGG